MRELHILAAFVHGALAALHTLGLAYNLRQRNRTDVLAHAGAVLYSTLALSRHLRDVK